MNAFTHRLLGLMLCALVTTACNAAPPGPAPQDPPADCKTRPSGERWKEKCNECYCSEAGEQVCTRKACTAQPAQALGDD